MEKTVETVDTAERRFLRRIVGAIRMKWYVFVAVIVASTILGAVFSYTVKPVYSASVKAFYKAKMSDSVDTTYDYTVTRAYLDTVNAFCVTDNVLSRADYYYQEYKNQSEHATVGEYLDAKKREEHAEHSFDEVAQSPGDFIGKELVLTVVSEKINSSQTTERKFIGTLVEVVKDKECTVGEGENTRIVKDSEGNAVTYDGLKIKNAESGYGEKSVVTVRYKYRGEEQNISYLRSVFSEFASKESELKEIIIRKNVQTASRENKYFYADKVSVQSSSATDETISFSLVVSYKDENAKIAEDMAKILVYAIDTEAKICVPYSSKGESVTDLYSEYKYFGVKISVADWGFLGTSSSVSRPKFIIVFFLLGVLIGLAVVYLCMILDRTVTDKNELESLTGVNCLGFIDYSERR